MAAQAGEKEHTSRKAMHAMGFEGCFRDDSCATDTVTPIVGYLADSFEKCVLS